MTDDSTVPATDPADKNLKAEAVRQAADYAAAYVESERDTPVTPLEYETILPTLRSFRLDQSRSVSDIISTLAELGASSAVRSTGGRYFGFVTGGTEPASLAASILASAWDQNAALPVMSPLAAAIDTVGSEQVIDLLNLPETATAAFCAGASVANLTAIISARDALLAAVGWDVTENGLNGASELNVVISDEAHVSVDKALRLVGIGRRSIVRAPVDANGCIDPDKLPPLDGPTLVVAQAGNVNTGHSDPFEAIVDQLPSGRRMRDMTPGQSVDLKAAPIWLHVDGAFGLWAAASTKLRTQVAGVERADSWATDCHKWLNVPYDNGVVIVADGRHLANAMAADAAYLHDAGSERSPMHLGVQMSQAARAVPVWAAVASLGRHGVAGMVERCCALATQIAKTLEADGARILAPVVLNQVLVHFEDDATTDAVVASVAASGEAWMGGTSWQGRRAMRISISDIATTAADVDRTAAAVLAAWKSLD